MITAETIKHVYVPEHLRHSGQFAARVVGNCLSSRPGFPIFEGDTAVMHPAQISDLHPGDVIVFNDTVHGWMIKEYHSSRPGWITVRQYAPAVEISRVTEDVTDICRVDAIIRAGAALDPKGVQG